MEKKTFGVLLVRLFESKLKTYTDNTLDVWYEELKNLEDSQVKRAIQKLINSPDNFISIGKIKEQIMPANVKAENAWERVYNIARKGGHGDITFQEAKALNVNGGMEKLMLTDIDKIEWYKKAFIESYNNYENVEYQEDYRCLGFDGKIMNEKTELLNS